MKNKFICLFFLFFAAKATDEQLLVVVVMVKNEAEVIIKTLQPFADEGIKHFLIFDTGSTDGTQAKVYDFFKKEELTESYLIEEPFIDFATSRNHALRSAEKLFPKAPFIIMPDAEWYIHNAKGLLQFCAQEKNCIIPCYYIQIKSFNDDNIETMAFTTARLIRAGTDSKFIGPVHEVLNQIPSITLPNSIYFKYQPNTQGRKKTKERWLHDKILLLKEHQKEPLNSRTLFYLAQTYECLGELENAYIYYKKRAAVKGWLEEDFITFIRLGDIAQKLLLKETETTCPHALFYYLKAYELCPKRAESLIRIAKHYLDLNLMHLAFLFATQSVKIPYPENDLLFIEKEKYTFTRYDILGICAWYVQEYEIGEWAVRKALEALPETPHLQRNLKLYLDHKNL
jgi:hypothetical protein